MNVEIVRADSGGEAVVWLFLAVIWVIAQLVSRARKGPSRPPPLPGGRSPVEDDLQRLFKTISEATRLPPTAPPTQEPPLSRPMRPVPYGAPPQTAKPPPPRNFEARLREAHAARATAPRPQPQARAPAPRQAPRPSPVKPAWEPTAHEAPPPLEVSDISQLGATRLRAVLPNMPLLSGKGFRLRALTLPGAGSQVRPTPARLALFQGRQALKQAVIARVVLGPPKALGCAPPSSNPWKNGALSFQRLEKTAG